MGREPGDFPVIEIRREGKVEDERQCARAADHPREPRSPGSQVKPHEADQRDDNPQTGKWSQRRATPNSPVVSARISHSSQTATRAVAAAISANSA